MNGGPQVIAVTMQARNLALSDKAWSWLGEGILKTQSLKTLPQQQELIKVTYPIQQHYFVHYTITHKGAM